MQTRMPLHQPLQVTNPSGSVFRSGEWNQGLRELIVFLARGGDLEQVRFSLVGFYLSGLEYNRRDLDRHLRFWLRSGVSRDMVALLVRGIRGYRKATPIGAGHTLEALEWIRRKTELSELPPFYRALYYYLSGRLYYLRRDLNRARRHLEMAVYIDEHLRRAQHQLAMIYRDLGDAVARQDGAAAVQAEEYYLNYQALSANEQDSVTRLAECYLIQGRILEARKEFLRIAGGNRQLNTIYKLGLSHLHLGEVKEAAACFKEILKEKPGHSLALNALANIFTTRGDYAKALRFIERARELLSDDPMICNNYGRILTYLQRFAEAEAVFRRIFTLEPDTPCTYYNLAVSLCAAGKIEQSRQYFSESLNRFEKVVIGANRNVSAGLIVALSCWGLGRFEEAERRLRHALELCGDVFIILSCLRDLRVIACQQNPPPGTDRLLQLLERSRSRMRWVDN